MTSHPDMNSFARSFLLFDIVIAVDFVAAARAHRLPADNLDHVQNQGNRVKKFSTNRRSAESLQIH